MLERDDGHVGPALGPELFFAPYAEWPPAERAVFDLVRGRVLDVGCGAGRHSLEAQRRGLAVRAIDVSPGAIEVSRRRGVQRADLLPVAALDGTIEPPDTVLMLCGNFGLVGGGSEAVRFLDLMNEVMPRSGRIVLDSVDPYPDSDAADLAYRERNRGRGRMSGQVTIRIRYGERVTPWYDLLNVSAQELEELAARSGWRLTTLVPGEPPDFYAVLEKTSA